MASEESQFVARAERLAGPAGVVGFQAAAVREAAFAPQNRYVLPQFEEKTPYGFKRQDPYTRLFEDRMIMDALKNTLVIAVVAAAVATVLGTVAVLIVNVWPQITIVVPFAGMLPIVEGKSTSNVANVPGVVNTSAVSGCKHHCRQSETTTGFVAGEPLAGSVVSVIAIFIPFCFDLKLLRVPTCGLHQITPLQVLRATVLKLPPQ